MENISFTGIKNLYVGNRTYSKFGHYLNAAGEIKSGEKNYTDVFIRCELTNDEQGNHLDEFHKALSKCRPCYQVNCIDSEKPNQIRLLMKHFGVKDDLVNVNNSNFMINDYDIMLDEREILPLFSYMAKLTRTIFHAKGPSDNQKEYVKFINYGIHNEAVNFIENM